MVEVNITDIILLFAVFYIIAVIVERLIEFFAVIIDIIVENSIKFSFKGFIYLSKLSKFFFGDKAKIEENKRMTENRQKLINGITSLSKELPTDTSMDELKSEIKVLENDIDEHEKYIRKEKNKRIICFWIIGLAFSLLICFIPYHVWDIKLIEKISGLDFKFFDWIVSGLFISSGTKPLHDIIKIIEKSKPKK